MKLAFASSYDPMWFLCLTFLISGSSLASFWLELITNPTFAKSSLTWLKSLENIRYVDKYLQSKRKKIQQLCWLQILSCWSEACQRQWVKACYRLHPWNQGQSKRRWWLEAASKPCPIQALSSSKPFKNCYFWKFNIYSKLYKRLKVLCSMFKKINHVEFHSYLSTVIAQAKMISQSALRTRWM